MKNYTWTATDLYTIDTDTQTNYVVNVTYDIKVNETVNAVDYETSLTNMTEFEVVEGGETGTFIPFDNLTNSIVVGWIQAQLGATNVTNLEATLDGMLDNMITPPDVPCKKDLPW